VQLLAEVRIETAKSQPPVVPSVFRDPVGFGAGRDAHGESQPSAHIHNVLRHAPKGIRDDGRDFSRQFSERPLALLDLTLNVLRATTGQVGMVCCMVPYADAGFRRQSFEFGDA
jgi:hypothetical protein